jgi:hypothetical protein
MPRGPVVTQNGVLANESGQSIAEWILIGRLRWSVGGPFRCSGKLSTPLFRLLSVSRAIGNIHFSHIFVTQKVRNNGFHSRELFFT